MPSPSKSSRPSPHILAVLPLYISRTTTTIARLHRLLSRTSTLDTTLLTTTYTLHLLHSLLTLTRPTARLRFTKTLTPLTALLDEFRILLRLWGLLGIYTWAASTYLHPSQDAVLRSITWAQVCACTLYQALENGACLAGRGVIRWERERVARAWMWSGRAWMAYVMLEFARLGYQWREFSREDVKVEKVGREVKSRREGEVAEEKWKNWRRELGVTAAYAPMTVHYSLENGPLGEGSLGALGMVVGWLTFGKAWRESA